MFGYTLACLVSRMGSESSKQLTLTHPGMASCLLVTSAFSLKLRGPIG